MPLTVALTAQTRTAPTAMSNRLTPIPIPRSPFSLQRKRAKALRRYAGAAAPRAARLPPAAHAGSGTPVSRGNGGVPERPRAPHAHSRLGAAQLLRSVSRGAVRSGQPGVRLLAGDQV